MKYHDMIVEASDLKVERDANKKWWRRFKVRVLGSPAGEMAPDRTLTVESDERALQEWLRKLADRQIDHEEFFKLGRLLGLLLLPPGQDDTGIGVRELFSRSLDRVGQDEGLRLRLLLSPDLASLPWEYLYLDRLGTSDDAMAGFLALDPRAAIVRHEALPVPAQLARATGDITVLAALASPPNLDLLDLDREESDLRQALGQQTGVQLKVLKDATLDEVQKALPGTRVFHFVGHGAFRQQAGDAPGAEKLGVNLRGNEVRLVVLGGCETGRRAGI
jgi:hypothetical protein